MANAEVNAICTSIEAGRRSFLHAAQVRLQSSSVDSRQSTGTAAAQASANRGEAISPGTALKIAGSG
jgi:hypothetical protein